jgi:hypothetical protein
MVQFIGTSVTLFIAMLGSMEFGRWLRRKRVENKADIVESGAVEGVVFAVLGLLIAFTFNTTASRFDDSRRLIVEQANALGTAWLRVDLLPQSDRGPIRRGMRDWVKLSLDFLPSLTERDSAPFSEHLKEAQRLQDQTWKAAVAAVDRNPKPQYALLVLAPINDWIDLSTTRLEINKRDLPPVVMPTLIFLSLLGAMLAGFAMGGTRSRSPLHMLAFAAAIAFCLYVVIDLNHPRAGLIRVDAADEAMRQLYASMTADTQAPATQMEAP